MFDFIIQTSLRQRLMVLGLSLLLVVYGALTIREMPVDVFPDLNKPTVTLMTEAGGMAPEEVEQLVTFPLETALNGMPGVTRVRSTSGSACPSSTQNLTGERTYTVIANWWRNAWDWCASNCQRASRRSWDLCPRSWAR